MPLLPRSNRPPAATTRALLVLAGGLLVACSHWRVETSLGEPTVVAERPRGRPVLRDTGGQRRCVQTVEVDYVRRRYTAPRLHWRTIDLASGLGLIAAGGLLAAVRPFDDLGPNRPLYDSWLNTDRKLGVAAALGGALILTYSYGVVPYRRPAEGEREVRSRRRHVVAAAGCGEGVGDGTATQSRSSEETAAALRQLEHQRLEGLITEREYRTRRAALLRQR